MKLSFYSLAFRKTIYLILLLSLILLQACGGGTAGTGGRPAIQGRTLKVDNQVLAGAEVMFENQTVISDEEGYFLIEIPEESIPNNFKLNFNFQNLEKELEIVDVPDETSLVELVVVLQVREEEVETNNEVSLPTPNSGVNFNSADPIEEANEVVETVKEDNLNVNLIELKFF